MDMGSISSAIENIEEICKKETRETAIDDPESSKIICKLTAAQVDMRI